MADNPADSAGVPELLEGALLAQLDFPLPRELAIGAGTALFVGGWCFCPGTPIRSLALVINGQAEPVLAHGMPRGDVARAHGGALTSRGSWRSGFWGIARVPTGRYEVCELRLRAVLEGGGEAEAVLGRIPIVDRSRPTTLAEPEPAAGPFVAICMATHDPPLDLFVRQLDSIREQTHRNWICIISDDCSQPTRFRALQRALGSDPRFVASRSSERLGFYRNFERALSMVPPQADFVGMADQDDYWDPHKLATLLEGIGDAQLAYSDARIVDRDGALISPTYWSRRRNNHADLLSLLVANSVSGAASLFRRDLLDDALPFPPAQFAHYHDHWIALTALALGEITFIESPLYDYVQHRSATLGHTAATSMPTLRDRISSVRRDPRERIRTWRRHYFIDVCRLVQIATVLEMRCSDRMAPSKRRSLEQFLGADRSLLALGKLALRGARELLGQTETLGAEWMLFHAYAWRRLLAMTARGGFPGRGQLTADTPPNLIPRADLGALHGTAPGAVAEKIAPLELATRDDAPERVNILIPTIDLGHLFGGYIAKFNLARRLAERGLRVRIVTVDPVGPLPRSWAEQLQSYNGLSGILEHVELTFGRESDGIEISRSDRFIATTWWTAHIARRALRYPGGDRFLYLIQEYEPFTFSMGTYAALARESYEFAHFALFSTELLRDYFRCHAIGVYGSGRAAGDAASASFENAITAVDPPSPRELSERTNRRLLFYSRPESHAARNMFELGVLALREALERGAFSDGWELNGIGTLGSARHIALGAGSTLRLLPRHAQRSYANVLRDHDVGLALMYTPHPSLVPIEMASAGMLTVTNSFENKTPEKMAEISTNLITVAPTVEGVAAGLVQATAGVGNLERRARASAVRWSRDWNTSFNDELLARVVSFLRT